MRLGIFGGSFDPVHLGHLLLAENCREQARLDQVWFMPAATPPHKPHAQLADGQQRVEMLKLAIGGHESFAVSTLELDRGGVSYTVDTLEQIRAQHPVDELFLLMGADSLADFPTWRSPERILELALPIVVRRVGSPEPDIEPLAALANAERVTQIRASQVEMPAVGISSSEIRRRVAAGKSIRYWTPRGVEKMIEAAGLYRTPL